VVVVLLHSGLYFFALLCGCPALPGPPRLGRIAQRRQACIFFLGQKKCDELLINHFPSKGRGARAGTVAIDELASRRTCGESRVATWALRTQLGHATQTSRQHEEIPDNLLSSSVGSPGPLFRCVKGMRLAPLTGSQRN
jgi:hypothetical protein